MEQFYEDVKEGDLIRFRYKNWKDVVTVRKAFVKGFFFGKTEYHPDYQCFIKGFDLDKMAIRDFAVKDISALEVING
ncbi:hypothetical protein HPT25_23565 [Bacillus sp. BRMEA1]|uniref:hypothetical protein n=1 Tax=Neobacillus endophyticus TaxID=2738405 RepID=UPI001564D702|nr:hypothetical protein [Neobacillus endophyticus]NRD80304.1 hypothetical protein [Neobacillus endophyticus]